VCWGVRDLRSGFWSKMVKSHFLGKMVKKSTFGLAVLGVLWREQRVNAVFREHFMCVVGFVGLADVAVVNAVFREHFMCVGGVWDPRIWVWSKMVKKSLLTPAMPRTAKIMTFGETF